MASYEFKGVGLVLATNARLCIDKLAAGTASIRSAPLLVANTGPLWPRDSAPRWCDITEARALRQMRRGKFWAPLALRRGICLSRRVHPIPLSGNFIGADLRSLGRSR